MNVDLGIWSKLTKVVVGLVVLAMLLLIGMCYLPLIQENTRMRAEILKLNQQLEAETNKLTRFRRRLTRCATTQKPSSASPAKNSATQSPMKR